MEEYIRLEEGLRERIAFPSWRLYTQVMVMVLCVLGPVLQKRFAEIRSPLWEGTVAKQFFSSALLLKWKQVEILSSGFVREGDSRVNDGTGEDLPL